MLRPVSILYRATIGVLVVFGIWGLLLSLFPLQPFWIDEWRLIYNLKFTPLADLWQPLKYTQQFPRLYLAVMKLITDTFQYSYTSLRLPTLLISVASMVLAWRLMRRLFNETSQIFSLVFVLIIVSSQTFTTYFVQTKHYEAEIFLALVAIWQSLELHSVAQQGVRRPLMYLMLIISMLLAPFFSYTYPIAIAPTYLLLTLQMLPMLRRGAIGNMLIVLIPLFLGACAIGLFYYTDVRQLMQDESMHKYWAYRMVVGGPRQVLLNIWFLFADLGSGFIFELVFGLLGLSAFLYGLLCTLRGRRHAKEPKDFLRSYAVTLVVLALLLYAIGKLPLGEAKFTAFCTPAQSFLIVILLQRLYRSLGTQAFALGGVLYAALMGNLLTVIFNSFYESGVQLRLAIYRSTQSAITLAQQQKAPLLITPEIALPDLIVHKVPFLENMSAAAILQTFPAYDASRLLPVYSITDTIAAIAIFQQLPTEHQKAMVGNGLTYHFIYR